MSNQPAETPDRQPTIPSISPIEPGLYLGNKVSSLIISTLIANKITAIVSLSDVRNAVWNSPKYLELVPRDRHMFIECLDSSTQELASHLAEICDFIDKNSHDETASNVLVHCEAGTSRSATIVVAYLIRKYRQSLDSALASVKSCRKVKPNANFMEQLAVWDDVKYELWIDPAKTIPKPPYAAYLARRAERLKEQGLTGNEPINPVYRLRGSY